MKPAWRWFGPDDPVTLNDIAQAGAAGIVTALHGVPNGTVWSSGLIEERKNTISKFNDRTPSGLRWDVVESLPVSEDIKLQCGEWRDHIENYKASLRNLADADIRIVCYNFMPVLDWTRTDIAYVLPNGGTCLRFDAIDFAAFDLFILGRANADNDYERAIVETATARYARLTTSDKKRLSDTILLGLPGAEQGYDLAGLAESLTRYDGISADKLRQHQIDFLSEIIPVAEKHGIKMCVHPDDPPFSLLGLPRIMSTHDDYKNLFSAVDSPANGMTFCAGSLGVNAKTDLSHLLETFVRRVGFVHLRNITRDSNTTPPTFHESGHIDGAIDMVAIIKILLSEETRRGNHTIPYRPDHGQAILTDICAKTQPGYPAIGRLKGLGELRGIITALTHTGVE